MQDWIPEPVWLNIMALSEMDAFKDLPESVTRTEAAWRHWYDAEAPERTVIPALEEKLSKFQRMCIVRVGSHSYFVHILYGFRGHTKSVPASAIVAAS